MFPAKHTQKAFFATPNYLQYFHFYLLLVQRSKTTNKNQLAVKYKSSTLNKKGNAFSTLDMKARKFTDTHKNLHANIVNNIMNKIGK